ncbi:hypothetical protein [Paenibacillus sp. 7523-1]|uniref:hypothetical protein n=1 Tax=Paenibacillus sp. 7523-1 TaxID=2022550 RepID=UPI000BA639D6|nr:hypothetical protein [Paenibacillus sp. 7523-1]PAD30011.1 hypothetical protein CHH60_17915 [Paenibacillus sp. 7523-1]
MKTIEEFLTSDWYKNVTAELVQLKPDTKFVEHASYEAEFLMDSFRERMYTLYGFGISSPAEEECVQWITEQLAQDKEHIMSYVVARLTFSEQLDDDPDGEFREEEELDEGDKSEVVEILGFTRSVIADTVIEYDLVKNHPQLLTGYFKRTRIPGAAKFSSQIKKVYASIKN